MNKLRLVIAGIGLFALGANIQEAQAQVPSKVNFQGRLHDSSSSPITGNVGMVFSVWDALSGGSQLWTETQVVPVSTGIYTVALGSVLGLSTTVFSGDATYLQIQAGADSALSPRISMPAVPYAFQAQNFLNALPISDFWTAIPVNATIDDSPGYTVPSGKSLILSSNYSSCGATRCNVAVSGSHTATNLRQGIAAAGDILASTSSAISIGIQGALVNTRDTIVLQDLSASGGTYTAPAGQNLYFLYFDAASSCSGTVSINGFLTSSAGAGILPGGQTLTNNRNCAITINGWLK